MLQISTLGALLSTPPPRLADDEIADLARTHFGLEGTVLRMSSERDLNARLTTAQGRFVLKLANPSEPAMATNLQTEALLHLAATAPDLPVPRLRPARDGRFEIPLPQGTLRLLTYLEGVPLLPGAAPRVAALSARLARGLQGFSHPAARHHLPWDIRHCASLRPLLPAIADPARRADAARHLDHFAASVSPALETCRRQILHNDLNPHNLLCDPADPARISGILDFGDMVETALICDLAIAAAYQIDPANPVASLAAMAAAFHAELPLTAAEAALLPDLARARMITTLVITAARAARYPANAPYILRNLPRTLQGLDALAPLDPAATRRAILQACTLE